MACVLLKSVSWFAILKYCLGLPVVRFLLLDLARHIQFTKVYINRFIYIYIYIPLFDILFGSQSTSGLPGCVPPCPLVSSLVLLCPPMSPVVSWCPRMSPHCWDTCPRVSPQVPPCPRTAGTHVPACPRRSLHVPARAGTRVPQCPSVSPGVP